MGTFIFESTMQTCSNLLETFTRADLVYQHYNNFLRTQFSVTLSAQYKIKINSVILEKIFNSRTDLYFRTNSL